VESPHVDDRPIWDAWLSQFQLPVVLAAEELGVFTLLDNAPATVDEIAARLGLLHRSAAALAAALAAMGFLLEERSQFGLTATARTYLLPRSDFYWIPMLRAAGYAHLTVDTLLAALRTENLGDDDRITRRWERGEMSAEDAHGSNQRMHSHSFPSALGLARRIDLSGVRRLLDVGGGSGCYAIALAMCHPEVRCTVADLPPVANDARAYVERYGCQDRVDTHGFNMFHDPWPNGYDAILLTNVLHDWEPHHRERLIRTSHHALPPGGRLLVHEILLNDAQDGPLAAALFSVMMLNTRGKQLSRAELEELMHSCDFAGVRVTPTYGYYSLVEARKAT
jgi:acetylserotonin N-methyltransferase